MLPNPCCVRSNRTAIRLQSQVSSGMTGALSVVIKTKGPTALATSLFLAPHVLIGNEEFIDRH